MPTLKDYFSPYKDEEFLIEKDLEEVFLKRRSTLLILPAVCRQVLNVVNNQPKAILAGGAALELYTGDVNKIKDWDIFFPNIGTYYSVINSLRKLNFIETSSSEWGITLKKSDVIVQCITKIWPQSISDLFAMFDFSVCCFAVQNNKLCYTKQAAEDVELKQLNYIYSSNIITTVKRLARYGQKGYVPTTKCVKSILENKNIPEDGPANS